VEDIRVGVVGAGYVGCVAATGFAELGWETVCMDVDEGRIAALRAGEPPIYEPGLEELLRKNLDEGRLYFTTDMGELVERALVIFITVGTPPRPDGAPDMSQVESAARKVAENLREWRLIVEKSTVPVRTAERIRRTLLAYAGEGAEFEVACNPEFLREGCAIEDFLKPSRIILGVESKRGEELLRKLYGKIESPIIVTDINTAEVIKHASNSFLAMKISYMNMVAELCERVGADIKLVAEGMGLDPRIGPAFLRAGIGYGGSCFPKDVDAFVRVAREVGVDFDLLEATQRINIRQRTRAVRKLQDALWTLQDKRIALLGLSFKPDTDDVREAPALYIARELLEEGARVRGYDPRAGENAKKVLPELEICNTPYEALEGADACLLATEWDEFRELDWKQAASLMARTVLVDGRNMLDPEEMRGLGFEYIGFGR